MNTIYEWTHIKTIEWTTNMNAHTTHEYTHNMNEKKHIWMHSTVTEQNNIAEQQNMNQHKITKTQMNTDERTLWMNTNT